MNATSQWADIDFVSKTSCITNILVLPQARKMRSLPPSNGIGMKEMQSACFLIQGRFSHVAVSKITEIIVILSYSSWNGQISLKVFVLFFVKDKWANLKEWNPRCKTDIEIWSSGVY